MSLFGATRPKGITKDELHFVRGELRSAPMGHGAEKLTESQVDHLMELLEMASDADSAIELQNHWEQVNSAEAMQVEQKIANDRGIHYSDTQRAHVHRVLQKYLDINKVKSFI